MTEALSYAGSEKRKIVSSDVVFGSSDDNLYHDCVSINVNHANHNEMRNEFSIQTPNASATDRPSDEHPVKDRHSTGKSTIQNIIQQIRYQKRKVPDKNLISQVAKNKYKLDSSVTHKTLDDMEKDEVVFVKDTGSYFIKSCRPKKSHIQNSKEANLKTVLVDHEDQFEPAIVNDYMSNEDQFTNSAGLQIFTFLNHRRSKYTFLDRFFALISDI